MIVRSIGVSIVLILAFGSAPVAAAQEARDLADKDLPKLFTKNEIQRHRERIGILTHAAAECLTETYADHVQFYQKWHVSKYYGDRKAENATESSRAEQLKKFGAPAYLVKELEPISCIGLTIKCLEKGFQVAGEQATWKKIYAQLSYQNKFYGTDLQKMLVQLGWTGLYWNPDPTQNEKWDIEDRTLIPAKVYSPAWGDHVEHYNEVMKQHKYSGIPVANSKALVGFKDHVPPALRGAPFYVGTAHSGYHVFPGFGGNVIEAHSTRPLNSFENLEVSLFNPMDGGGPKWTANEKYRSGVILILRTVTAMTRAPPQPIKNEKPARPLLSKRVNCRGRDQLNSAGFRCMKLSKYGTRARQFARLKREPKLEKSIDSNVLAEILAPTETSAVALSDSTERMGLEDSPISRPIALLSRRGPKTYATCPPCKSSWSLRERLFDLRSGKPLDLELLACPTCRAPIALPEGLDLKSIK